MESKTPNDKKPVFIGRRLSAVALDFFYSYVFQALGGWLLSHGVFASFLAGAAFSGTLYWIINWVYFLGMTGATLGKHTLGLRVVQNNGRPLDVLVAMKRSLAWVFSLIPLGLGFLPVFFSSDRKTFHDWIAGTLVERQKGGLPG